MTTDSEAAEARLLLPDELLVRDGVAKLHLCWFAWTLAQWHQCGRLPSKDGRSPASETARRLWERLRQTTCGRGFGTDIGASTSKADNAGIRALIRAEHFEPIIRGAAESVLKDVAPQLCGIAGKGEAGLNERVVAATWAIVNDLEKPLAGPNKVRGPDRSPGGMSTTARIFRGSRTSAERTSADSYREGRSLEDFQSFGADSPACSPMPLRLLIRWGRILGFGPLVGEEADDKKAAAAVERMPSAERSVWDAFCGVEDDVVRGAPITIFADALQNLIDSRKHVDPAPAQAKFAIGRADRGRDNGAEPPESPRGSAAELELVAMSADEDDSAIAMRLNWNGRISISDLKYRFAPDAAPAQTRVCLKALEIRWDWKRSDAVTIDLGSAAADSACKDALAADNRAVEIVEATHDVASLTIQLAARYGAAFAPRPERAVGRLTMPRATLVPMPGLLHEFSVRARKQDLCLARRDGSDSYRQVDRGSELASMDEQVRHNVELAYVEIENNFPSNGKVLVLGTRRAEARRAESTASPPDSHSRERVA